MKTLIVDDEAKARRILEALIKEYHPELEIVGTADDVPSAVQAINEFNPELVFLDIEMPKYSGFQLFEFIPDPDFDVVFATAYGEYAIRAFEVSAADYLLKPIQSEALGKAIDKVKKRRSKPTSAAESKEVIQTLRKNIEPGMTIQRIALPVADGLIFVDIDDILYFEADASYTHIYLKGDKKLLVTKYLKFFQDMIQDPRFYKPHRSYYINLNHIQQYVKNDGGSLVMSNGGVIHIARDKKDEFLQVIGQWNPLSGG